MTMLKRMAGRLHAWITGNTSDKHGRWRVLLSDACLPFSSLASILRGKHATPSKSKGHDQHPPEQRKVPLLAHNLGEGI